MSETTDLVESYLGAFAARDFELARTFLADRGFVYTSPLTNFDDPDRFIQHISVLGSILERLEIRKCVASNTEVIAIVDATIALNGYEDHTAAILFRIEHGSIKAMETIFDASDYHRMFFAHDA
jgi:hypothetical protein